MQIFCKLVLQKMGHSFRVLAVYDSYSAGRSDLWLLSGDTFSVCKRV